MNETTLCPASPIAVFDSGLGGLSVWREIVALLPRENTLYLADTLHLPYGPRPMQELRGFCHAITDWLVASGAKIIVVACNTASAAALQSLRQAFPVVPFVGMEPAVKPAAAVSRTGRVGVLATEVTLQGDLFASTVERFARGTEVICQPCPGLAHFIETRPADDPGLVPLLESFIHPLLERGVDNLVLGCTHYPLIKDIIGRVAGAGVRIIDPSPAIARRARQVLAENRLLHDGAPGPPRFFATGDTAAFARGIRVFAGRECRVGDAGGIFPRR